MTCGVQFSLRRRRINLEGAPLLGPHRRNFYTNGAYVRRKQWPHYAKLHCTNSDNVPDWLPFKPLYTHTTHYCTFGVRFVNSRASWWGTRDISYFFSRSIVYKLVVHTQKDIIVLGDCLELLQHHIVSFLFCYFFPLGDTPLTSSRSPGETVPVNWVCVLFGLRTTPLPHFTHHRSLEVCIVLFCERFAN